MSRDAADSPERADDDPLDPLNNWLSPHGWQWDAQSLSMGEYVGFKLYLLLRDRFTQLRIPPDTHDLLIQEMIDTHDVGLYTDARGKVTMCYVDTGLPEVLDIRVDGGDTWPDLG
jgi:hypothetical protein